MKKNRLTTFLLSTLTGTMVLILASILVGAAAGLNVGVVRGVWVAALPVAAVCALVFMWMSRGQRRGGRRQHATLPMAGAHSSR